jgi:hypothetical protein
VKKIEIPIALFGFNRPDLIAQVISNIKKYKLRSVWCFIDGARDDHPEDSGKIDEVHKIILETDWECPVKIFKNIKNKGLRNQIRDGLDEFFKENSVGLILEDDIIIADSAVEYINKIHDFIDGEKIVSASLNNFIIPNSSDLSTLLRIQRRPYLTNLFHCWGWVTTRNGWSKYVDNIEQKYSSEKIALLDEKFSGSEIISQQYSTVVDSLKNGLNSWAYRYQLSMWHSECLSIAPPINLAINIGFRSDATHTKQTPTWVNEWTNEELEVEFEYLNLSLNTDCDLEELALTTNRNVTVKCGLCGSIAQKVFTNLILGEPHNYYECISCQSLMNSNPTWLDKAYQENISIYDTGVIFRNFNNFVICREIINQLSDKNVILEFAAGSGILTRMLRDTGIEAYATDAHNKPSLAGSFTVDSIDDFYKLQPNFEKIILAFEVFEHFIDPKGSINDIFRNKPAVVISSTEIYKGQDSNWSYLIPFSGQHVFFYSYKSLVDIAEKYGYQLVAEGGYQVFVKKELISRMNEGFIAKINNLVKINILNPETYQNNLHNLYVTKTLGFANDYQKLISQTKKEQKSAEQYSRIYLNRPTTDLIYIDCVFFQSYSTGIAKMWNEVFRIWSKYYSEKIVLIDRGGDIESYGLKRVKFQKFNFNDHDTDIRALSWFLMQQGAKTLLSSYYTYCEHLPVKAVVYDMIPEKLGYAGPVWDLKNKYLSRASSAFSISENTQKELNIFHPNIKNSEFTLPGISPLFQPLPHGVKMRIRESIGVSRKLLFILPCSLYGYKDGVTALKACELLPNAEDIEIISTVNSQAEIDALGFKKIQIKAFRLTSDEHYAQLVSSSDLVLWPSTMEGVGFPPIEAILSRVKMICARTPINLEIYGQAPNYFEPSNVEDMREKIMQVINSNFDENLLSKIQQTINYDIFSKRLFEFANHN